MSMLRPDEIASMLATLDQVANAALVKIEGPGELDASGEPGAGLVLWEGEALGYFEQHSRYVIAPGGQATDRTTVFTLLDASGAPVVEVPGPAWEASLVTIEDRRLAAPVQTTWKVAGMEHSAYGTLDSVRLELDRQQVT